MWAVRYNHFHDQLVLTSSSDSRVVLNNVGSISSEPYGHLLDDDMEDGGEDSDGKKSVNVSEYDCLNMTVCLAPAHN